MNASDNRAAKGLHAIETFAPLRSDGERWMDRITKAQLEAFSEEHGLTALSEESQFEHFSAFATVRRHYDRTLHPTDIVVGSGGDLGLDAIAIIVNNVLVTDPDMIDDLAEQNGYIDATFVFVQAERSRSFDGAKLLNMTAGIIDIFSDTPKLVRNENIKEAALVMAAIYKRITLFRHRPSCICYYVTTGKWQDDTNLMARRAVAIDDLNKLQIFGDVELQCFGADEIQRAYNQTRNPISREFRFTNRTDVPQTPGVHQAFLGFIPVRAGFQNSRASRPATRNMQALCSSDWVTKPRRS